MTHNRDHIVIGSKIKAALAAPVQVKRWHIAAFAVAAFLAGLSV